MKVLILNGPNLQLLGRRKVEVYGVVPLPEIESRLRVVAAELGVELGFMQSNHEGVIGRCHRAGAGGRCGRGW